MHFEFTRREVLDNLNRFKEYLSEMRTSPGELVREYRALVNQKTGIIRFAQKISALEHRIRSLKTGYGPSDWIEIQIRVNQSSKTEAAQFEILGLQHLSDSAGKVIREMLDFLNKAAKEIKPSDLLPEKAILQSFTEIRFESPKERIENMPGWMGTLGRLEAEERLMNRRIGTYLLREGDEITVSISTQIAEANHQRIHPYLLTAVEPDEKISDTLILKTGKGWVYYQDEPNLNDSMVYHYYTNPQSLIRSLDRLANYPLL